MSKQGWINNDGNADDFEDIAEDVTGQLLEETGEEFALDIEYVLRERGVDVDVEKDDEDGTLWYVFGRKK